ncbi:TetR/AcrR family transcriptional regulator [Agrobacterium leguminum]|uniref:TetR/AcrR family transcriptional regulator n=1 Tax=Agrobacterium leguminum TaxID=2792015 RepID=UPI003CE53973
MRRKTEDQRLKFVESAGKLFIEKGFGAVTMEAVAAEAGASKATLYSYFPAKEALFEAFVIHVGKGGIEQIEAAKLQEDAFDTLQQVGVAYLALVTRPYVIEVNRLIMGEAGRHPHLSRIFYENGARRTLDAIEHTIGALLDSGKLVKSDVRETSLYFKALCDAGIVERQLWGLDVTPDERIRQAAVNRATSVFLSAFGTGSHGPEHDVEII